jgi:hypothetical protein
MSDLAIPSRGGVDGPGDAPHLDEQLLRGLLQGLLSPAQRAECERHVRDCARCRVALDEERRFSGLLRLDGQPPAGEQSLNRVLTRVSGLATHPARRRRTIRRCLDALGLFVVIVASLGIWYGSTAAERRSSRDQAQVRQRDERVVAYLRGLMELQRRPWLISDYETTTTLRDLLDATPVMGIQPAYAGGEIERSGSVEHDEPAAWAQWEQIDASGQEALRRLFADIASGPEAAAVLRRSCEVAGLPPEQHARLDAIHDALVQVLDSRSPADRRTLLSLPGPARAVLIHRILQSEFPEKAAELRRP